MLNQKLKDKFKIFEEIDKVTSYENTKQSSIKNRDSYSFNEGNNTSINQSFNFIHMGNCLKNLNKYDNLDKSFNNSNNKGIENLKGKFNIKKRKISSNGKFDEKNPEKFVFQFFYDKKNKKKSENNSKLKNNEFYPKKTQYYRHNKCCCKDKQNLSDNDINTQLINYKSKITKIKNYKTNKIANKSKENNYKINKLIKKLYNGGMKEKQKRDIIYRENLMKKNEEYKNYSFRPNYKKNIKPKKNKLKQLNDYFYSKQVEWKNKKDIENSKKKKIEEEAYLSQFTFKPNIKQKYIADDEKMKKKNLNDMNNYISKRRNQIKYKKENEFKLRDYKQSNIKKENNKYKESLTERIYYRNENGLNSPYVVVTQRQVNYSNFDFLNAVKNLHNEISNLNL